MDVKTISLHPDFPEKVWVIIEQPRHEPYRFSYDPIQNVFSRTTYKSLFYVRGFSGVYGWIGGTGTPPGLHYDVLLLTEQNPQPGNVLLGYLCGVFYRRDGDHKFVAMDADWRSKVAQADLTSLSKEAFDELMNLYPEVGENEGWYGAEEAFSHLKQNKPVHD